MIILKRYFINFWIWWYVVEARRVLFKIIETWTFVLAFMNVMPMLKNLFQPLYQDYTWVGRAVAFPIRSVWVIIGIIVQVLVTIPLAIFFLIYLIVPLGPFIAVFIYLVK